MTLYQYKNPGSVAPSQDLTVGVYEVTKAWTMVPHGTSWAKNTLTTSWTTPGGDYSKKVQTLVVPKNPIPKTVTYTITTAVQDWVNTPATNFGLILIPEAGNGGDGNCYYTHLHTDAANRPKLTVTYTGGTATVPGLSMNTDRFVPGISTAGRTLSYHLNSGTPAVMTIVNSAGRSVLTRTVTGTGTLDLGALGAGTYYARLGGRAGVMSLVIDR